MRMLLAVLLFALSSAAQACSFGAGKVGSFGLYYDYGESGLNGMTDAILDNVLAQMDGCRVIVVVSGHRDGSEGGELAGVSLARADGVRRRLQEAGVPALDILVRDMTFERPAVATPPGVGEPQNRRVELMVVGL